MKEMFLGIESDVEEANRPAMASFLAYHLECQVDPTDYGVRILLSDDDRKDYHYSFREIIKLVTIFEVKNEASTSKMSVAQICVKYDIGFDTYYRYLRMKG
jgi:hypothetical protein